MENRISILDKIVAKKKKEIDFAKRSVPIRELEKRAEFKRNCYVLKDFFNPSRTGIIAEFKRQSPSKGIINGISTVEEVAKGYEQAGASAISVLTDQDFFGGSADDLMRAREAVSIPLLRKDFMLDTYQLYEAKAWGADIVLLIAAILTPKQIETLSFEAQQLGLNVLLEVHNEWELVRSICPSLNAIGINNRNLGDFTVDIQKSFELVNLVPDSFLKISESAIDDPQVIKKLKKAGFNGFLIGENFMKTDNPAAAMEEFVSAMKG